MKCCGRRGRAISTPAWQNTLTAFWANRQQKGHQEEDRHRNREADDEKDEGSELQEEVKAAIEEDG